MLKDVLLYKNYTASKNGDEDVNKTIEQWNRAANKYTDNQEKSDFAESNKQVVKKRFKNLSNQKVLDLGCGYGCYTDYFQSVGADVLGVDGSSTMIEIAKNRYTDCSFAVCDITEPLPFEQESFDLVFCNQVLMDIENIEQVFSECFKVLKPGGTFYWSIVHPAFYDSQWLKKRGFNYAKAVSSYIEPYSFINEFWGETEHFHRPLSYYLNVASDKGFVLKHTDEPISYDGKKKNKDIPLFFFAEYKK